ncbi:MAG: TonB family protein [Woeseiaceae bacterium]|nr:TonB family protein [Woeseiaceae bacterium]
MPLEQFKTQVLLLHSEQSALDKLSAGFVNDKYTVHCATSGVEALNTLGETPIHVIVSASNLPGMSGADALREAKKRSPETIGILIAGENDKQAEALVGDKEIFQVIRGGINPKDITKLIDEATQQMRLMAIAESANDQAAEPAEGTGEHIVMETDDHGSTIISDGTGQHATLNPQKMSESAPVGAKAVAVLVMTKDEAFLESIKECCRGMQDVHTASSIKAAQELIQSNSVGVSIVDAGLVGPNVEKLTQHLQSLQKRLVTIVAGRREDGDMLMDLINRGKVYRFLLKPVSPGRVRLAVEASVKHHLDSPDSAFQKVAASAPPPAAPAAPAPASPAPLKQQQEASSDSTVTKLPDDSIVAEGLSKVFGEDDSRFAETVSGFVTGRGKSQPKEEAPIPSTHTLHDDDGGSTFANPVVLGGVAVAVLAVAGIGFWLTSGDDATDASTPAVVEQPTAATNQTPEPTVSEPAAPAVSDLGREPASEPTVSNDSGVSDDATAAPAESVAQTADEGALAMVAAAETALADDRLFTPIGDNALELYAEALVQSPDDAAIQAAFENTLDTSIVAIETALLEGRLAVVDQGVRQVSLVQPDHPRLPFLIAQLQQAQIRSTVDEARAALRSQQFGEAASAIDTAESLGADASTIDALRAELTDARSSQEIDQILTVAGRRLDQGRLLSPANDNARYLYDLVLRTDPNNAAARQGLKAVAATLVLNARDEIDAGRLSAADNLLNRAADIDPNNSELAATRQVLSDARSAATRAANEEAAAEAAAAERAAAEAQAAAEAAARPVPVSSLTRVKYVAPKYPRGAERRGISGWVDIIFTVSLDGSVRDVEVRDSDPGDTFVASAITAVERWEFEPVRENGSAVEKRAGVRLMFALE